MRDVLAGEEVLGGLVLNDAAPGLLNRHLRQFAVLVEGGDGCLLNDVIDLLLVVVGVLVQGDEGLLDQRVYLVVRVDLGTLWRLSPRGLYLGFVFCFVATGALTVSPGTITW